MNNLGHTIYGTKCATSSFPLQVKTLGEVYQKLTNQYGAVQLSKPVPGETYRKMYNSLNEMDGPAFRNLPSDITVLSPARLYRSKAWRYNGNHHMDAQVDWEFEYEHQFGGESVRDWMNVRILTYAYIPTNCIPMKRVESNQLTLF